MIDHDVAERLATRTGDLLLDVRAEFANDAFRCNSEIWEDR